MKKTLGFIIGLAVIILATMFISNEYYQPQEIIITPLSQTEGQVILNEESLTDLDLTKLEIQTDEINGDYIINIDSSVINWTGETLVKSQSGTIGIKSGNIITDDSNVTGNFIIDMTSINASAGQSLSNHLKDADFFNVDQYPIATVDINGYESGIINLDLTIKGITNTIDAPAMLDIKGDKVTLSSNLSIDRTLWEINYSSGSFFENLGDSAINDLVDLSVELNASK